MTRLILALAVVASFVAGFLLGALAEANWYQED